jgi:hypothetical protein
MNVQQTLLSVLADGRGPVKQALMAPTWSQVVHVGAVRNARAHVWYADAFLLACRLRCRPCWHLVAHPEELLWEGLLTQQQHSESNCNGGRKAVIALSLWHKVEYNLQAACTCSRCCRLTGAVVGPHCCCQLTCKCSVGWCSTCITKLVLSLSAKLCDRKRGGGTMRLTLCDVHINATAVFAYSSTASRIHQVTASLMHGELLVLSSPVSTYSKHCHSPCNHTHETTPSKAKFLH